MFDAENLFKILENMKNKMKIGLFCVCSILFSCNENFNVISLND